MGPREGYATLSWASTVGLPLALWASAWFGRQYASAMHDYRRRWAEAAERSVLARAQLEALFASTDDLIVLVNRAGRIQHANPAAARCLQPSDGDQLTRCIAHLAGEQAASRWDEALEQARSGRSVRFETTVGQRHFEVGMHALRDAVESGRVAVFAREITDRRKAERELAKTHRQLVAASRLAGMAEVASGVLHNIGNVLNSVNVSTSLLKETSVRPVAEKLERLVQLLAEQDDLGAFLASERGQRVIPYLRAIGEELERIERSKQAELERLTELTDHMAAVIGAQQRYARGGQGARERVRLQQLVDTVSELCRRNLERHGIAFEARIEDAELLVDRHKVLQILVNLVENAKDALREAARERQTTERPAIALQARCEQQQVVIEVKDNGCGIAPDQLERIFQHGFTTKRDGHGFGLHSAANAAGELRAHSEGPGKGATFVLTLPCGQPSTEGTGSPGSS